MDDGLGCGCGFVGLLLGVEGARRLLGLEGLDGRHCGSSRLGLASLLLGGGLLGKALALCGVEQAARQAQHDGDGRGVVVRAAHIGREAVGGDAEHPQQQEHAGDEAHDPQDEVHGLGPGEGQHANEEGGAQADHAEVGGLLEDGQGVDHSGHGLGLGAHGVEVCDHDHLAAAALTRHRAGHIAGDHVLRDAAAQGLGEDGAVEALCEEEDQGGRHQQQADGEEGGGQPGDELPQAAEDSAHDDQPEAQGIGPAHPGGRGEFVDVDFEACVLQVLGYVEGGLVLLLGAYRARTYLVRQHLHMFHEFGHDERALLWE